MNRAWRQRNRGAVLVEFAILAPILVLLVFGITELGRALYQQNILTKSVASGARYLARGYDILDQATCIAKEPGGGLGWSDFVSRAKNLVVYGTLASGGDPLVPNLEITNVTIDPPLGVTSYPDGCVIAPGDICIQACVIRVSAEVLFEGIFGGGKTFPPILGGEWIADVKLNAMAEERYIGQ